MKRDRLYDGIAHLNGLEEALQIVLKHRTGYEGGNNDFCRGVRLRQEADFDVIQARIIELKKIEEALTARISALEKDHA